MAERKSREERQKEEKEDKLKSWVPKTELGRQVKAGKIKLIDELMKKGRKILEPEIIDILLPTLETDLIKIGQSKGKFGGGKRRVWRQTQKKTSEGNVPSFGAMAVVGNKKGYVGIGVAKAKETLPARDKAIRKAKLNLIKIPTGCGSFDCACGEHHSIPFKSEGKSGSSKIKIMPAPKGTGLVIEDECKKVLRLAGIKDIYSKSFGQSKTKYNMIKACFAALNNLNKMIRGEK